MKAQGKKFFFEKKNQKTLALTGADQPGRVDTAAGRICKSFLVLFFKKERLSYDFPSAIQCN